MSQYDPRYDSIDLAEEEREREEAADERRAAFLAMSEDEQEAVIEQECREARAAYAQIVLQLAA